ncbi:hypothetical protein QA601_08925 [Chitinispirillales bacterium ANBcel5]|nr:hypothetical protein [Chitinispirillales bacterium ANBcel5]
MLETSQEKMLSTIDPTTAEKKVLMVNPGKRAATRASIDAFITSRKRPRVKIVMGRVRMKNSGFMTALTIPRRRAANMSVGILPIRIPGTMYAVSPRPSALITKRPRNAFIAVLSSASNIIKGFSAMGVDKYQE